MYRLPSPDLDHGRDGSASLEVAAASMVLGGASEGDAFQRHVGVQLAAQLGVTYKTAWLLAQKLRRSMIDPDRSLLEGVVEVDQTEIPFRTDDAFFDPRQAGKIVVASAVEVVDRTMHRAKPRKLSAKYLDTRSGRVRLAAIPDNSAASWARPG